MTKPLVLDNGLSLLMLQGEKTNCVSTNIFYAAGSGDEKLGKSGVAHFLEHLSFKSTLDFAAGEFDSRLKSLGASNNACTSSDYTHFYASSTKEHVGTILGFFASMMDRLAFKQEEFDAEKLVVLEEERLSVENSPFGKLWFLLHNAVYANTALAPSVIGFAREIQELSKDDVYDFYHRFYAPNNALIVLSGDVDSALQDAAIFHFASKKSLPPQNRSSIISPKIEPKQLVFSYPNLGNDIFALAFKIPSFNHPDFKLLSAFARYLNLEHSSALWRIFINERALCCDIEAYAHASRHESLFVIFGTCCEQIDATNVVEQIKEFLDFSLDFELLKRFILLDIAQTCAMPKALASELGTAWAMGDFTSGLNALKIDYEKEDFKRLEKYFHEGISIILKEEK